MPLTDLSNPDILLRENWGTHLSYGTDGTPLLPPSFVAELGPRVWIVDLREDADLVGPQGHIPGIWRVPFTRIGEMADLLPAYTPVVLVCEDGKQSTTGARFLRALGMTTVAAMNGGMCSSRAPKDLASHAARRQSIVCFTRQRQGTVLTGDCWSEET